MNDLPGHEDKSQVTQLRNNIVTWFDSLFYKYNDKLYRFLFLLLKNQENSKGIVQKVFCRNWCTRHEHVPATYNKVENEKLPFLIHTFYNIPVGDTLLDVEFFGTAKEILSICNEAIPYVFKHPLRYSIYWKHLR